MLFTPSQLPTWVRKERNELNIDLESPKSTPIPGTDNPQLRRLKAKVEARSRRKLAPVNPLVPVFRVAHGALVLSAASIS